MFVHAGILGAAAMLEALKTSPTPMTVIPVELVFADAGYVGAATNSHLPSRGEETADNRALPEPATIRAAGEAPMASRTGVAPHASAEAGATLHPAEAMHDTPPPQTIKQELLPLRGDKLVATDFNVVPDRVPDGSVARATFGNRAGKFPKQSAKSRTKRYPIPRTRPVRLQPRPTSHPASVNADILKKVKVFEPSPQPQPVNRTLSEGKAPPSDQGAGSRLAALRGGGDVKTATRGHGSFTGPSARPGNRSPEFPIRARRRGWEGRVVLRVRVGIAGEALSVEVKESSGYQVLDRAARKAVKAWKFVPGQLAGVPVVGSVDVPIEFRLK